MALQLDCLLRFDHTTDPLCDPIVGVLPITEPTTISFSRASCSTCTAECHAPPSGAAARASTLCTKSGNHPIQARTHSTCLPARAALLRGTEPPKNGPQTSPSAPQTHPRLTQELFILLSNSFADHEMHALQNGMDDRTKRPRQRIHANWSRISLTEG